MKTRILTLFLALVNGIGSLFASTKIGDLYYNLNANSLTAEVTYKSSNSSGYNQGWNISVANIPSSVIYSGKTYNVTSIGWSAFEGCIGLTSITVNSGNTNYDSRNNCNAIIETSSNKLIAGCKNTIIPNSVTSIGSLAFNGCTSLTSVTIPNSVTSIGNYAFSRCSGLTSIEIPNSVTSIGKSAFYGCSSLTYITMPNGITIIEDDTFYGCTSLATIEIPSSVTSIGSLAFDGCTGLTSITIPNSVTSIGSLAFAGCTGLTSITIPNSVTSIGISAFSICRSLTSVEIQNGVTSIGEKAFYGCSGLTSVTIPNSVTSIGYEAFDGCRGLTSIEIPNSVTSIGRHAFFGCTGLTYITMPNGITIIEDDTFYGCTSLATIEIPSSVITLGNGAFCSCIGLTSVTIPNSVTSIGDGAFSACNNLSTIDLLNENPPTLGENAFPNSLNTIYVPCGSSATYSKKWKNYASIIQYKPFPYSVQIQFDSIAGQVSNTLMNTICDTILTITATPNYGYHFVKWDDGSTNGIRVVHLVKDTILTAEFAKNIYTILYNADATYGHVQGVVSAEYLDTITFEAKSNYGYHFTQWSDAVLDNPRTIVLTRDTIFEAEYAPNKYSISVTCDNSKGEVTGSSGEFDYLNQLEYKATPWYGYHFTQWSDGVTINPRIVILEKDTAITAEFAPNNYSLSVTCDENLGTIDAENGEHPYLTELQISATPNYGYHFTQWSDGVTENPRTITITEDIAINAVFAKNKYTIMDNSNHIQGSIQGVGTFDYLSQLMLIAEPEDGYHFTQWSDGLTNNPRQIILTQDTTFIAEFGFNQYSISVACDEVLGSIDGENGVFDYLTKKTYEAIPHYGYHFVRWSDGETQNPRTITITEDIAINAVFAKNLYTIVDYSNHTQGYIYGSGMYEYLDEITLTPRAKYGYHFIQWSDGVMDNPRNIILTQDTTFAAEFAVNKSGACGDGLALTWTYNSTEKVLTISGEGALTTNYTFGIEAPEGMQALIIESGVTAVGNNAFNEKQLNTITLPNTLVSIGNYAFAGNKVLKNLVIPNSVTSIGNNAFEGGNRLLTITLGQNIESIGNNAFRNCPYILEIHAPMEYPPIIDASVFDACGELSEIKCYVPEESMTFYRKTNVWKEFNLFVETGPTGIDSVSGNSSPVTHKILRDGQILILRGEKVYTVTGQEVR